MRGEQSPRVIRVMFKPGGASVDLGRIIMRKADLPLRIYDTSSNKFDSLPTSISATASILKRLNQLVEVRSEGYPLTPALLGSG